MRSWLFIIILALVAIVGASPLPVNVAGALLDARTQDSLRLDDGDLYRMTRLKMWRDAYQLGKTRPDESGIAVSEHEEMLTGLLKQWLDYANAVGASGPEVAANKRLYDELTLTPGENIFTLVRWFEQYDECSPDVPPNVTSIKIDQVSRLLREWRAMKCDGIIRAPKEIATLYMKLLERARTYQTGEPAYDEGETFEDEVWESSMPESCALL